MNRRSWMRWLDSFSDNRQSKIGKSKMEGLLALAILFVMCGAARRTAEESLRK